MPLNSLLSHSLQLPPVPPPTLSSYSSFANYRSFQPRSAQLVPLTRPKIRISCVSIRPKKKSSAISDKSEAPELVRLLMRKFNDKEPLLKTLNKYVKLVRTEHCFLLFEELGKDDKWLQCLEVFRWMQKLRWYIADNGVYSKLISVMGRKGQTRMAMWLFSEMRNTGCRPDTSVYNALIQADEFTCEVWSPQSHGLWHCEQCPYGRRLGDIQGRSNY